MFYKDRSSPNVLFVAPTEFKFQHQGTKYNLDIYYDKITNLLGYACSNTDLNIFFTNGLSTRELIDFVNSFRSRVNQYLI